MSVIGLCVCQCGQDSKRLKPTPISGLVCVKKYEIEAAMCVCVTVHVCV